MAFQDGILDVQIQSTRIRGETVTIDVLNYKKDEWIPLIAEKFGDEYTVVGISDGWQGLALAGLTLADVWTLAERADGIQESEAFLVWVDHFVKGGAQGINWETAEDDFIRAFAGIYSSYEEYGIEFTKDEIEPIFPYLPNFIDWDALGRWAADGLRAVTLTDGRMVFFRGV